MLFGLGGGFGGGGNPSGGGGGPGGGIGTFGSFGFCGSFFKSANFICSLFAPALLIYCGVSRTAFAESFGEYLVDATVRKPLAADVAANELLVSLGGGLFFLLGFAPGVSPFRVRYISTGPTSTIAWKTRTVTALSGAGSAVIGSNNDNRDIVLLFELLLESAAIIDVMTFKSCSGRGASIEVTYLPLSEYTLV